jgi:hypothetical protein
MEPMTVVARPDRSLLLPVLLVAGCGWLSDPPPPPDAPAALLVEPASTESIALTWNATSDPDEFRLERARGDSTFEALAAVGGSARSYLDTGLAIDQRYRYRLQACGEGGCSDPVIGEASTYAPLLVVTGSLPPGFVGVPYGEAVNAQGGDGEYGWSIQSGAFPPGLVLSDTSGIITGTPEEAGRFTFTLQVRDAGGRAASQAYTVRILADPPEVSIRNYVLPPVMEGGTYQVQMVGNGGDGQAYGWSVDSGALPPGLELSADGQIQGTATTAGTYPVAIRVTSSGQTATESFTIRVVPGSDGFAITTFPVVPVPPSIQPHVDSAAARWEEAITGNLVAVTIPVGFFGATGCGGFGDTSNGTTTDDILMILDIAPIDGPGQVLGRAGPCGLRGPEGSDGSVPFVGLLTLDSDDLTPIAGQSTLTDIIFHEMGHVLGFGSLWDSFDLVFGSDTADPVYTGAAAVAEWRALDQVGDVPVENTGGAGTENVHWRETVFNREIMTGFIESGVDQPLSRITIAAMEDLGYEVDRSAADDYSLLQALRAGEETRVVLGYDVLLQGPILVLDPDGSRSVLQR